MSELNDLGTELKDYELKLYNASTEYSRLIKDAATKRADYDVQWAQELLQIATDPNNKKLTVGEKEAMVLKIVQVAFTECRIAEAMAEGAKRHLATLQSNLSSIQTRSKILMIDHELNRYRT